MALEAEAVVFPGQKCPVLRGMRIVAGEALPFLEGSMVNISACFQGRRIVTQVAEIAPLLGNGEGALR